jgi:hypothetical protein
LNPNASRADERGVGSGNQAAVHRPSGEALTTSKPRGGELTTTGVAAIDAVTVASDRSRSLIDSGGGDLLRVLFEGVFNNQGVVP